MIYHLIRSYKLHSDRLKKSYKRFLKKTKISCLRFKKKLCIYFSLTFRWIKDKWQKVLFWISIFPASFITLVLLGLFYFAGLPNCTNNEPCHQEIGNTIAQLMGTILALVYSLAIVGFQIAGTNYSRSVVRMLFRDRKAQISVLITFSLIVISLFLSQIKLFPFWGFISANGIFYFQIFLLGLAVDAIHFFYTRVININDPLHTLDALFQELSLSIKKSDKIIRSRVKKKEGSEKDLDGFNPEVAGLYALYPDFDSSVNYYINDIFEVSHKALQRNDYTTTNGSLQTIVKIMKEFLNTRKDTIFILPSTNPFMMMSCPTSVDRVVEKACEELMTLNKEAIRQEKENINIKIIQAFWQIIDLCLQTKISSNPFNQNALVTMPLSYIGSCVLECQRKGMMEVPWEFIKYIPYITSKAEQDIQAIKLYLPLADTTNKVIHAAYTNKHEVVAKQAITNLLHMVSILIERNYWQLEEVSEDVLKKVTFYFSFHKIWEIAEPSKFIMNVFSPFDTSSNYSLQILSEKSRCLIKKSDPREIFSDPYLNFIKFNKILSDCFSELFRNQSPGKSFTMHGIVYGLDHILRVYYLVIEEAEKVERKQPYHISNLIISLKLYIWPLSFIKEIDGQYAKNCGDVLGVQAIHYAKKSYTEISIELCKVLLRIALASYKTAEDKISAITRIFYDIWCVEKYLEKLGQSAEAEIIKKVYTSKSQEVSEKDWGKILVKISEFPANFKRELNNGYSTRILKTPEGFLINWLEKNTTFDNRNL